MKLYELNDLINAQCPIYGIDSNGGIDFKEEATDEQKAIAQSLMDQHLGEVDP